MNEDNTEVKMLEWYEGETLQYLSKCINFKIVQLDGKLNYGHKVNGSWTGLMGALHYGSVEINYFEILSCLFLEESRIGDVWAQSDG